ncbi:MAG: U32 family peptidase, partial [Pedosphaera parvula]|nr:U32 family peptidase [Pedosphaera parvula]
LIRRLSPDFPIHASTQMTVTCEAGVEFARELGADTVVLARECSVKEIAKIHAGPITLQAFVHGALCVAYSGQCLTSEALGGRSANRGECAQACRMPYELLCDGQPVPLGDRRYLLSPQDLAGLEMLPDLIRAGVASLKIEGRLKAPEYVANITRVYRQGIDRVLAELTRAAGHADETAQQLRRESSYDLEMAFSRGLFTGWMRGINNQELVHGRFGTKRGVFLGEVTRVQGAEVFIRLEGPVKPGDGVVFDAGRPDLEEQGGRVYSVTQRGADTALSFGRDDLKLGAIHPGNRLWKTSEPQLERRVRQSFAGDTPKFQRPLHLEVHGRAGLPLTVVARDNAGHVSRVASNFPLAAAEKQPLTEARLREQLGRLGGTPFCLGEFQSFLEGAVILPVSELNRLRREAVAELETQRVQPRRWQLHDAISDGALLAINPAAQRSAPVVDAELIVMVRSLPQLEATLRCGVRTIYAEFEDPKKYRSAVQTVRLAQGCGEADSVSPEIWVAPPRIFKPGEEWILPQVRSCDADGYLVRNHEHLQFFAKDRRRGDYSLNVANGLSAEYFL